MERIPIQSSNLTACGYDAAEQTLEVCFTNGSTYRYMGVGQKDYDAFMAAESKGKHLAREIKGKFEYERVNGPDK